MQRRDVLAESIARARRLLPLFLAGFDDASRTAQAPSLPNHAAWTLGHCAWELHELAAHLDHRPMLPDADFVSDPGATGNADRYAAGDVEQGSTPHTDAGLYPSLARGLAIYDRACERLIVALDTADERSLDAEVSAGGARQPLYKWVLTAAFHTGYHAGQMADLRRALAMPPLFPPRSDAPPPAGDAIDA